MKYLNNEIDLGAESGDEAITSSAALEARLQALGDRSRDLEPGSIEFAQAELDSARILIDLERGDEAWTRARRTFDLFFENELWTHAVEACDVLFLAEQADSLSALGQGVWLGVTFPVDPELTVAMLQHIINETPDDSDGAAVSAATAVHVVDMRATGKQHDDLHFFVMQMLSTVARRHSEIEGQEEFSAWMQRLELTDPSKFLGRLRNVVDVLVQDDWWFDRDEVHARIPVN